MSLKAAEGKKSDEEEGQRGDKTTSTKSITQGMNLETKSPTPGGNPAAPVSWSVAAADLQGFSDDLMHILHFADV